MKIHLNNFDGNIYNLLRKAGYHLDKHQREDRASFSRALSGDKYPRFHIYYDSKKKILYLHLDQKAPKYESSPDHGAEYDGRPVEEEAEKIKSLL